MNQKPEAIVTHPSLIPITGNYDRKPRTLDRDVTIIGRARGSDLCLEANEVSTLHCTIYRTSEGFRIRDCSSRTGTRINGESIKNHLLHDGDIINLGPFSFEVRIPPALFPRDSGKFNAIRIMHMMQSRRNLAEHALKLRRRLRSCATGASAREAELVQKAQQLKEKIRSFDHRKDDLEAAERELAEDREKLSQEKETHRAHVQEIESGMADRLARTESEIHQRWQEFQQRCQAEEARLNKLALSQAALQDARSACDASEAKAQNELQKEMDVQKQSMHELEEALNRQQQQLRSEREELSAMKDEWATAQAQAAISVEEQKSNLAKQEAALRFQKSELLRMMGDLKNLQEDLRKKPKGDLRSLQIEIDRLKKENSQLQAQIATQGNVAELHTLLEENDALRQRVDQLEQSANQTAAMEAGDQSSRPQVEELRAEIEQLRAELRIKDSQMQAKAAPGHTAPDKEIQRLRAENELLSKLLQEKELSIAAVNDQSPSLPKTENDLERYESELNDYRRQLDMDRTKLNQEVELLRERNQELDEAIREMEMEMSKERAELARERTRLERVRDEIKGDMERFQREMAVRDSMAPLQKLREEIVGKQGPANGKSDKALNDRLKSFRNQLTDSTS